MIKILILPEVIIAALEGNAKAEQELLQRCQQAGEFKAWTFATTIRTLHKKGYSKTQIRQSLQGIAKIPINDFLSQQALDYKGDFDQGLQLAAVDTFKLSLIVGLKDSVIEGKKIVSATNFLKTELNQTEQSINFMDLSLPVHSIFDQVDGWFMEIIQNTAFAGGNHVAAFEEEYAAYVQAKYAIGVGSGTDALRFALLAMGVESGDEVITVPNTFIATTEAITQAGAKTVFVDVLPDTYNMDPSLLEAKITARTKVILPVHLYGQMADLEQIIPIAQKHNLKVLEDACQAHGAEIKGKRAGSMGDAAAFSLYPGKNLGAFGEAGCVTTNNPQIAKLISQLRDHGQEKKYYHGREGYNGRMDNLQAAVCRAKIPYLDGWNQKRRRVAELYTHHLQNNHHLQLPTVPTGNLPVFHLYVILVEKPLELQKFLQEKGIFSAFHYPVPLHQQTAYRPLQQEIGSYPVTENCAKQLLSLPMFPELTEKQIIHICKTIDLFYG